ILANMTLIPLVTGADGEGCRNVPALVAVIITLALELISMVFVLKGRVRMAKAVVLIALVAAVTIIAINSNGLKNTGMVGLPIILVISAILLGKRALFLVTPLAVAGVIIVAVLDLNGRIPFVPSGLDDALIVPILLIASASITHLLIIRLNENIERARKSEGLQRQENAELIQLRNSLE